LEPTFATIAKSNISENLPQTTGNQPQNWILVGKKSKIPLKIISTNPKAENKPKEAKATRRLVLTRLVTRNDDFSSLVLRNAFNKAFFEKGIKNPVIDQITEL
jgi:hypothetical protein